MACPSCGQPGLDITSLDEAGARYVCVNLDCPRDKGTTWTEPHEPHYDPDGARRRALLETRRPPDVEVSPPTAAPSSPPPRSPRPPPPESR